MQKSSHIARKSALRIVVDTNVIISGVLTGHNPPGKILALIAVTTMIELLLSEEIFTEYREVMQRAKFRLDRHKIKETLSLLYENASLVYSSQRLHTARDENDNKFLECAIEGKADYLITGNIRHFPAPDFQGIKIITPTEFIAFWENQAGSLLSTYTEPNP